MPLATLGHLTQRLMLVPVLLMCSCSINEDTFREEFAALYCSAAGACESDHPLYMDEAECNALVDWAVVLADYTDAVDTAGAQTGA